MKKLLIHLVSLLFVFSCGGKVESDSKEQLKAVKIKIIGYGLDLSQIIKGTLIVEGESLKAPITTELTQISEEIEVSLDELPADESLTFYAVLYDEEENPIYDGIVITSLQNIETIEIYLSSVEENKGINDKDNDSVPDEMDNCPDDPNLTQTDTDEDTQGDLCDPCPTDPLNTCRYNVQTVWEKNFGGNGLDTFNEVIETSDQGYILVGYSKSTNIAGYENIVKGAYVVKVDADGNLVWEKIIEESSLGYPKIIEVDNNNFILAYNNGGDIKLIGMNLDGEILWEKYYGGSKSELFGDIAKTKDGGFVVLAATKSDDIPNEFGDIMNRIGYLSIYVIKCNSIGDMIWSRILGEVGSYWPEAIIETSDNNFVISGRYQRSHTSSEWELEKDNGSIMKISDSGELLWEKFYQGIKRDTINSVREAYNGNIIAVGFTQDEDENTSGLVIKYRSNGEKLWEKLISGNNGASLKEIKFLNDNEFIIVGNSSSNDIYDNNGNLVVNNGETDNYVLKMDMDENILWQRMYGYLFADSADSFVISDQSLVIAGRSCMLNVSCVENPDGYDAIVRKVDL